MLLTTHPCPSPDDSAYDPLVLTMVHTKMPLQTSGQLCLSKRWTEVRGQKHKKTMWLCLEWFLKRSVLTCRGMRSSDDGKARLRSNWASAQLSSASSWTRAMWWPMCSDSSQSTDTSRPKIRAKLWVPKSFNIIWQCHFISCPNHLSYRRKVSLSFCSCVVWTACVAYTRCRTGSQALKISIK